MTQSVYVVKVISHKTKNKSLGVQQVKKKGSKMADTMVVEGDQTGGVDGTLTRWIDECQLSTQRLLMDTLVLVEVHRYPLHNPLFIFFHTQFKFTLYCHIRSFWSDMYTDDCFGMMREAQLPCWSTQSLQIRYKMVVCFFASLFLIRFLISGSWFSLPRRSAPSRSGRLCRGQGQVQINWPARAQSPGTERSNKVSARN